MGGSVWVVGFFWVVIGAAFWCRRGRSEKEERETGKRREKEEERRMMIPRGSSGWPIIGETLDFIACGYSSCPVSFMDKRRKLYGRVFRTHLLGKPILVSTDADVNRSVLNSDCFVPSYPNSVAELLGENSILQTSGALHRRVHGLIGGFLKSSAAKDIAARDLERCVVQSLSQWPEKSVVFVQEETMAMTFPPLVKVLMGLSPGEDLDLLKEQFHEFVQGLISLPIKLPGTRFSKSLKAKAKVESIISKIVKEKTLAGQTETVNDVVDVLINEVKGNNAHEISMNSVSSIITELMIPGEHSVPMMMTLAVKYLTDAPSALEQLREENLVLRREKVRSGEPYAWADYMSLTFTHYVINEVLRMANIVNAVWRKAIQDVEVNGYLIPKDWCIMASFSSVHLNAENYPNPYEFNPWRWEKGVCGSKLTPFGGGQRLCPGQDISRLEISIFLHHLVTQYRWVAEEDVIVSFPMVKMKRKLPIRVSPLSL